MPDAPVPDSRPLDLSRLWEEHTSHEFTTRDTEATLATMVDDAYVNHIPVLTGGCGKAALREFYSQRFIPAMPPDTALTEGIYRLTFDNLPDGLYPEVSVTFRVRETTRPYHIPLLLSPYGYSTYRGS